MDYKINFDETIPQMIDRLKREHIDFEFTLKKITKYADENELNRAIETIYSMKELIIKHAIEEEARIMRVIMHEAKEESTESIKIMQEHNWVVDFLKHKLQNMEDDIHQQNRNEQGFEQQKQLTRKNEINEFVSNLRSHFSEEEQIVFPLALKSDLKTW